MWEIIHNDNRKDIYLYIALLIQIQIGNTSHQNINTIN